MVWDGYPEAFVFLGTGPSGNPVFGHGFGLGTYGQTQLPLIPAPSICMAFLLAFGARRRRQQPLATCC